MKKWFLFILSLGLSGLRIARADETLKLDDNATVQVQVEKMVPIYGLSVKTGEFSPREIDGKRQPAVTAEVKVSEDNGELTLNSIKGNIWNKTAMVYWEMLRPLVDQEEFLDTKVFERIYFSSNKDQKTLDGKPQIEPQGKGKFLVHAFFHVKNTKDIPVDLNVTLTKDKKGKITAKVITVTSAEDKRVGEKSEKDRIDRHRLGLYGKPYFLDPGVVLGLQSALVSKPSGDKPEPDDFSGGVKYRYLASDANQVDAPAQEPAPSLFSRFSRSVTGH